MFMVDENNPALIWKEGNQVVRLEPWGQDSLRVRAAVDAELRDDLPHALLEVPRWPLAVQLSVSEQGASIQNGRLLAEVSAGGVIRYSRSDTRALLLAEEVPTLILPPARHFQRVDGDNVHVEQRFDAQQDERLYGLGQYQHGRLDQKGCVLDLTQINTQVTIPFLLSSRGYGFLWNNPALGRVELGVNRTRWVANSTKQLDYWVTAGDTPADILARYLDVTGYPPMLPEWAAGFWQSKLRYDSQENLLAVAREHKARGLPLDALVIDFFHWTLHGDWQFDPVHWPDPVGMVRELEALGVRVVVSVWPTVNRLSRNYEALRRRGWLVRTSSGDLAHTTFMDWRPEGTAFLHHYDATHPEARAFVWAQLREGYHRHGIKAWWADACEPELVPPRVDTLQFHAGSAPNVANLFPLAHAQTFYDGMKAEGEEDVVVLARSAWAGSQRYGVIVWSGDVASTFDSLRVQVQAGLNMALSGIAWWSSDVGGFHSGDPSTPYFRELVVRWFQYGVFCPVLRLHGHRIPDDPTRFMVGAPNEVWQFGDEVYGILREWLTVRERLRPYLLAQMRLAHERGVPPMRPLLFDFPDDPGSARVEDAFMCGPDLLVAPVVTRGSRSREVYLPAGTTWRDAFTGQCHPGGQTLQVDAPLERIPLFLRGDATVPIYG